MTQPRIHSDKPHITGSTSSRKLVTGSDHLRRSQVATPMARPPYRAM